MKNQPTKKSQEVLGQNSIILSQYYHGKPPLSSAFRAIVVYIPFSELITTPNCHYQRRKIDLCGCYYPNYFARLVPDMGLFSKVWKRN